MVADKIVRVIVPNGQGRDEQRTRIRLNRKTPTHHKKHRGNQEKAAQKTASTTIVATGRLASFPAVSRPIIPSSPTSRLGAGVPPRNLGPNIDAFDGASAIESNGKPLRARDPASGQTA